MSTQRAPSVPNSTRVGVRQPMLAADCVMHAVVRWTALVFMPCEAWVSLPGSFRSMCSHPKQS